MGKIKLPDEIEKWEKKSLREDIGSEKEHTHTIYVYKNIAIEHEHDCGCDAWNPYVLVDGHPFKLHGDYFHNFDEALGYIKGALKEKKLLDEEPDDDDDEPEEPEFPKAEANDMSKSFVMPTAREMFAEAHALPDMYELAKSREMHKQQMREFFDARKAEEDASIGRLPTEERSKRDMILNDRKKLSDVTSEKPANVGSEHATDRPKRKIESDKKQRGTGSSMGNIGKRTSSDADTQTQKDKDESDALLGFTRMTGGVQPERKGRMAMGTYTDNGVSRDLGSGHTHFTEAMLGVDAPQNGGKPKGIYGLIDQYNRSQADAPGDIKNKLGIGGPLSNNLQDLSAGQLIQLLASGYKTKDPLSGKYDMKPEYEEQLEIPAGFDLSKPIFLDNGRVNLDALANFQMGNPDSATHTPIKRNAYTGLIHLTNGWDPTRMRAPISDDRLEAEFDSAMTRATDKDAEGFNPNALKQFMYGDISLGQLQNLVNILGSREGKSISPTQLNSMMGFDFGAYDQGVPQKQEGNLIPTTTTQEELTDIEGDPSWDIDRLAQRLKYLNSLQFTEDQYNAFKNGDREAMAQAYLPEGPLKNFKGQPRTMNHVLNRIFNNPAYYSYTGNETVDPESGTRVSMGGGMYKVNPLGKFPNRTYSDLMPKKLQNKQASMAESRPFREIMEERIQKADAEAGIPSGFVGMHPHKAAYKTVWLGYGKDATYPFVLKNALTGEKVCEVSDIPRDERKD